MADILAPFLKIRGASEIDGVVFDRLPADNEKIETWIFDRAFEPHRLAALGALEQRRGIRDARFKLGLQAGLDLDLCNFKNHRA